MNFMFRLYSFNIENAWHKTDIPENANAKDISIIFRVSELFRTLIFFIPLVISNVLVSRASKGSFRFK